MAVTAVKSKPSFKRITSDEWFFMSERERLDALHEAMADFDDFDLFLSKYGWQPWMKFYTDSVRSKPCETSEVMNIDLLLLDAWCSKETSRTDRLQQRRNRAINRDRRVRTDKKPVRTEGQLTLDSFLDCPVTLVTNIVSFEAFKSKLS